MLAAFLMIAVMGDWVPVRWPSGDPATLSLLDGTPVNCLLQEQKFWSSAFTAKAAARDVAVLGILRAGSDISQAVRTAKEQGLNGVVLEGEFPARDAAREAAAKAELAVVELPLRRGIHFDSGAQLLGTTQGVWPGIRVSDDHEEAPSMPSGAPWIDTNTGFLRYARAMYKSRFWMANTPPEGQTIPVGRYLQAIADAAITGAQWVVALDSDFSKRLMAHEEAAVGDWKKIAEVLAFYQAHREFRDFPPAGLMAVVQDAASGALLSGSVLDMIAVKHTPVRPVPGERLSVPALAKTRMAVNVDPGSLTEPEKNVLKEFTHSGGTVLNGPPGWKMPATSKNGVTVDKDDVEKLDAIWKEMNTMTGRQNLGVRLFNVSSMLSYLQSSPDGKRVVLHLVNYSDYPIEAIAAHILGHYKRATISVPGGETKPIEPYEVEDGAATGLDIPVVPACAIIVLEAD